MCELRAIREEKVPPGLDEIKLLIKEHGERSGRSTKPMLSESSGPMPEGKKNREVMLMC